MKFYYLDEDSEDLKPDTDVVKVLTEDSEDSVFSFVFLLYASSTFYQKPMNLKIISKWICDKIIHSTNKKHSFHS